MISFDEEPGTYSTAAAGVQLSVHVRPHAGIGKDSIKGSNHTLSMYGVNFFFESHEQAQEAAGALYNAICKEYKSDEAP